MVELMSIPRTCAVLAVPHNLNTFHSFERVNDLILRFVHKMQCKCVRHISGLSKSVKGHFPCAIVEKPLKSPDIVVLVGYVDGSPTSGMHHMDPTAETIRRRVQGCQKPRE